MMRITLYDRLLIAFIIIAALLGFGMQFYSKGNSDTVTIQQNGSIIAQVRVNGKDSDGLYHFNFNGGEGTLEVKEKKVRMLPMPKDICPEEICSLTGWIEKKQQTIVCLPNKLIVSFKEDNNKSEVDSIAF